MHDAHAQAGLAPYLSAFNALAAKKNLEAFVGLTCGLPGSLCLHSAWGRPSIASSRLRGSPGCSCPR
eukprot:9025590-Alexandrium_andersonii.AAC.1